MVQAALSGGAAASAASAAGGDGYDSSGGLVFAAVLFSAQPSFDLRVRLLGERVSQQLRGALHRKGGARERWQTRPVDRLAHERPRVIKLFELTLGFDEWEESPIFL